MTDAENIANGTEKTGVASLPVDPQGGGESEASAVRRYDVYLKERATLGDQQYRTSQAFDKAILAVSAGAFVLTPTLIQVLGAGAALSCKWLAVMGLACLGIAVLCTLFAMTASQKACMAQERVVEERFLHPQSEVRSNRWQTIRGIVNWISLGSPGAGLVSVAMFAAINFL